MYLTRIKIILKISYYDFRNESAIPGNICIEIAQWLVSDGDYVEKDQI